MVSSVTLNCHMTKIVFRLSSVRIATSISFDVVTMTLNSRFLYLRKERFTSKKEVDKEYKVDPCVLIRAIMLQG